MQEFKHSRERERGGGGEGEGQGNCPGIAINDYDVVLKDIKRYRNYLMYGTVRIEMVSAK